MECLCVFFFFQAEDGIRDVAVTGVQTCALPISEITDASFTLTNPFPSIFEIRFCSTVCFAHKNSPVAASKLQAIPVLQGMPVKVLRGPRRAFGLVANMPEAFPSGLTGVLMIIISNVHSWSQF